MEESVYEDDVDDLIKNKYSTEFFQEYIQVNGIYKTQKIVKWIDGDVLPMILRGMTDEEAKIIDRGVYYLHALIDEQGDSKTTTFNEIRLSIARAISDKEGSINWLKENRIFNSTYIVALNPRWKEFEDYCFPKADDICRNYGAIELLKKLSPHLINWMFVSIFHRDMQFIEDNIDKVDWESILMNDYMMLLIERHIDEIDSSLRQVLSSNASAIYYLEQHPELIEGILSNSNIITYDYEAIKQDREWLRKGIVEYFYHPRFIQKWLDEGNDIEDCLQ